MEVQELLAKYFSQNVNNEEKEVIEKWRNETAENELEFIEFKKVWSASNPSRFDSKAAFRSIESKLEVESPVVELNSTRKISMIWKVAAAVALLVTASLVVYQGIDIGSSNDAISDNSSAVYELSKKEVLGDGSIITLAPTAQIEMLTDFSSSETREVKLTGKGYFDIARNESKPFIIHTNNAQIKVLGTSFVVDNSSAQTEITVESGLVSISRNDIKGSVELEPGDVGLIKNTSKGIIKHKNENDNYLAWKTGILYFNRTSLGDVSDLIEELYSVKVKFQNDELRDCKISATFQNRKEDEILEIIARTFDMEIVKKGKSYLIKGEKC